jgi:hypothetical protein
LCSLDLRIEDGTVTDALENGWSRVDTNREERLGSFVGGDGIFSKAKESLASVLLRVWL